LARLSPQLAFTARELLTLREQVGNPVAPAAKPPGFSGMQCAAETHAIKMVI